jgi:hypothetical protein
MTVHVGQTYRDLDPRLAGRTLKVEEIKDDKAIMEIVTNAEDVQDLLDDPEPGTRNYTPEDRRGKRTTIGVERLAEGKDFALMAEPPDIAGPVA